MAKHIYEDTRVGFFTALKKEAKATLDTVIERSLGQARDIVDSALNDEMARFKREESLKKLSLRDATILALEAISLLWNFSAAESGLLELQNLLENILNV